MSDSKKPTTSSNSQSPTKIEVGDKVQTAYRGGQRIGKVEKIEGDKVTFTDQHGHKVTHKMSTLKDLSKGEEPE
ncbi:hypothetical protein BKA69DRAFT_1105503 [Paraphysoderma sedebokerense]|nr:hypothetical protein BKA69DRAFT_1105503 [Paraphysoderma sedebokerense]